MTWTFDGADPTQLGIRRYALAVFEVLELSGECDVATQDEIRAGLERGLANEPRVLLVDLSRVTFCDSICAALILDVAQRNPIAAVAPVGTTALILDLLDPSEDLPRYRSVDHAAWDLSDLGGT